MPVENFKIKEKLQVKIEKRIYSLVEDGIIAGVQPGQAYRIFFSMAIQFVPKYSKKQFSFGVPEGIRLFIQAGRKVVAAVDFVFRNRGVQFSHIYQGAPLDQLVNTVRRLKRAHSDLQEKAHLELIQFFYTRSHFVLLKRGRKRNFYRNTRGKLTEISLPELRGEIEPILKDRPEFDFN